LKWRVSFTESLAGVSQNFDFDGLVHIDRNGKKVGGPAASSSSSSSSSARSASVSAPATPSAVNKTVIKSGGKTPQPPKAEPPAHVRKEQTRAQIAQPPPNAMLTADQRKLLG